MAFQRILRPQQHGILSVHLSSDTVGPCKRRCGWCNKIAEAEAVESVNEENWLVMHVCVRMRLDELRAPPNPWLTWLRMVGMAFVDGC